MQQIALFVRIVTDTVLHERRAPDLKASPQSDEKVAESVDSFSAPNLA